MSKGAGERETSERRKAETCGFTETKIKSVKEEGVINGVKCYL